MDIKFFDWVALIGAGSWVPLILTFLKEVLKRPNIVVRLKSDVEIGFNTLGPIINPTLALISYNKSSLIKNMVINCEHDSNYKRLSFDWNWYEETLMEMEVLQQADSSTLNIPYRKRQDAIALNVIVDTLIEKKVGFKINDIHRKLQLFFDNPRIEKIKETSQSIGIVSSLMMINVEWEALKQDAERSLNENFNWEIGKYNCQLILTDHKNRKHKKSFSFNLDRNDILKIKDNINISTNFYFRVAADENSNVKFNWIYKEVFQDG